MTQTQADYQAYVFDLMGVLISLDWRDTVIDHLTRNPTIREIFGGELIDHLVEKGLPHIALQKAKDLTFDKNNQDHKNLRTLVIQAAMHGLREGYLIISLEDDAEETFVGLTTAGSDVYLFSSADREFMELILGPAGPYVTSYFSGADTAALKNKYDPEMYRGIAETIGIPVSEMCYITDDPKEAEAAVKASLGKVYLIKDEVVPVQGYVSITSLLQIVEETVNTTHTKEGNEKAET